MTLNCPGARPQFICTTTTTHHHHYSTTRHFDLPSTSIHGRVPDSHSPPVPNLLPLPFGSHCNITTPPTTLAPLCTTTNTTLSSMTARPLQYDFYYCLQQFASNDFHMQLDYVSTVTDNYGITNYNDPITT
eukprot:6101763-Amphidinium_carterae.1